MTWNMVSESVSIIILCIIWIYSKKGNPLPTLRNKLFQMCFFVTFCAMASNIISTLLIYNYKIVPIPLTWIVTTIYFVATPLMGVVYFYYTVTVISKDVKQIKKISHWGSIPAIIYLIFIMLNPFNKCVFDINSQLGYVRGPFVIITYVVFYVYCLICVLISIFNKSQTSNSERKILYAFPILAIFVVFIQQIFPNYILSGSAATCALLLIYLYLENKQISIDYLTELPNRQVFLEMLGLKIKKRNPEPFSVIVLSLKGFKQINNKFGQQNGNLCLQQISAFLKEEAKQCLLYRFSGDEFAILLEANVAQNTDKLVKDLQNRMTLPWQVDNYNYVLSSGIGVMKYNNYLSSVEEIVSSIEYATAMAKRSNIANCVYCTREMLNESKRRDEIVEILKNRIKNNTLEVYFQPIYDVRTKNFSVGESLSRLNNTTLGSILPSEFIPIAENTGLIIPMTYQILDKVCKFIKSILDNGVDFYGISINLSVVQFSDKNIKEKFIDIIRSNGIPYSKIKIEITESVLVSNFDVVQNFMEDMHEIGISFGLDDFGTGYSNISSVLQLPWDTIKIDRSLIVAAIENERSAIIIKHIASGFSALGINLLAEGVENSEHDKFAKEAGCKFIQGFLYAKPTCDDEARKIIGHEPN